MLKAAFLDNDFAKRDLMLLELRFHDANIDLKRYFRKKVNIIDLDIKLFDISFEANKSPALQIAIGDSLLGNNLNESIIVLRVDDTDVLVHKDNGQLLALRDCQLWQLAFARQTMLN